MLAKAFDNNGIEVTAMGNFKIISYANQNKLKQFSFNNECQVKKNTEK